MSEVKIIKVKNGKPTVIEWNGQKYIPQVAQIKSEKKKGEK